MFGFTHIDLLHFTLGFDNAQKADIETKEIDNLTQKHLVTYPDGVLDIVTTRFTPEGKHEVSLVLGKV